MTNLHESLKTGIDPRNGPAEEPNASASSKLFQQLQGLIEEEMVVIRADGKTNIDALGVKLGNLENRLKLKKNEELDTAVARVIGLEDILRIMNTDPENRVQDLPDHLRRLNDRVGGLETLFAEADRRAEKSVAEEQALDPRAQARQLMAENLETDVNLARLIDADPRLTPEYAEMQDRWFRGGEHALTREDQLSTARAHDFCARTSQHPRGDAKPALEFLDQSDPQAALSTAFAPGAGLLVSPTIDSRIRMIMAEFSAIVDLANKPPVASNRYVWYQETGTKPTVTGGREDVTPTSTSTLEGWEPRSCDIFHLVAKVPIFRDQLEDSSQDLVRLLTTMVGKQFGIQASTWTMTGAGVDEPNGLLTDGTVPTLNTGVADEVTLVALTLLSAQVKAGYLRNAVYIFGDDAYKAAIVELDDSGRPKWQPSTREGSGAQFAGHRVFRDTYFNAATTVTPDKVTFTAGDKVAWFGDPSQHFIMPQRRGTLVVRDEVTSAPTSIVYSLDARVGFAVDLHEAGVLMVVNS